MGKHRSNSETVILYIGSIWTIPSRLRHQICTPKNAPKNNANQGIANPKTTETDWFLMINYPTKSNPNTHTTHTLKPQQTISQTGDSIRRKRNRKGMRLYNSEISPDFIAFDSVFGCGIWNNYDSDSNGFNTYLVTVTMSEKVDALCTEHDWALNAVLTVHCLQ